MSIYKPCDIRGNVAAELTPALYKSWGHALAARLGPGKTMVAGGDVRGSTPPFLTALIDGLRLGGANVIDLGLLPTPMIYFAKQRLQADGCVIVTASHNPATVNGLKWMLGGRPPAPEDVAMLERYANGSEAPEPPAAPGTLRAVDASVDYGAWLGDAFRESEAARLRVVLDPMHGSWAGRARRHLQSIFPHCEFSAIRDTADARFGDKTPDCAQPRLLGELCAEVRGQQADLGFAFDGDGDRVALVDGEGVPLKAEEAVWVLLQSFGRRQMDGCGFVYDLKFSDRVPETARQLGAEALVERSGHAFIRTRMCETGSLFGAEISGHYFYRALNGGDDGLFTACRVIAFLAGSAQSLAALRSACGPVHISPDLRVPLAPDLHPATMARIRDAWRPYPQQTIDGVRIDTPEGWILVRSSVTEPALTFRFEGRDSAALEALVARFCEATPEIGIELREAFARGYDPSCRTSAV